MSDQLDLTLLQLGLAYVFILILFFIFKKRKIKRNKLLFLATIRMTVQLVLVGYILVYIFDNPKPLFTFLVLAVMEVFAINNIFQRVNNPLSNKLKITIAISMAIGTLTSIFYFLFVVVRITPYYNPQFFIPIAGMLIGNSMTGITLGVSQMTSAIKDKKTEIENSLMLGARPKEAVKNIIDDSFDSAIVPTLNSMLGMGVVFLPGMMTGQILAGLSPISAIKYQIAIMLGILGSVSLTVIIFLYFSYKTFFNEDQQLIS